MATDGTNVGIGTASPDNELHILKADASQASHASTILTLENSADTYAQMFSGTSGTAAWYFGDSGSGTIGGLEYLHSTNMMKFRTNEDYRMVIDSSGNVGIGVASPADQLHLWKGEAGGATNSLTQLLLEDDDHTHIQFETPADKEAAVYFGDPGSAYAGSVEYAHSLDKLSLRTSTVIQMSIDSTGAVTKPNNPAFLATSNAVQSNISTGNTTVIFETTKFDQGSDFGTTTFTAPVTGRYHFDVIIRLDQLDIDANYYVVQIVTSNNTFSLIVDPDGYDSDPNYWGASSSILADMDASDTAYVNISQDGGAAQTDISTAVWFSGWLAN
jgi:hypothetical protein